MVTLKQYLADNSVRQEDFAKRVGTTQATVSKLVHQLMDPAPDLARRIHDETGGEVPFWTWPAYAGFAPKKDEPFGFKGEGAA